MVAECQGSAPASMDNCYEADNHGLPLAFGAAGIPNTQYAITTTAGAGQASIDVETGLENSFLGCGQSHPCSLVVVPGQGGAPGHCTDHSGDLGLFGSGNALASNTFSLTPGASGECAWANRIVIPLSFAPTPNGCPQRNPAFTVVGSPMAAGAMQQWLTGLCAGRRGMTINYDSTLGEPTAVTNAVNKIDDVALTTLPASADGVATGNTPFVYAPIAVSAVSVAYWIDNVSTGEQLGGLKLNQRLLAKLLTTSYTPNVACKGVPPPANCDPGVDRNPFNIFFDPEFKILNPAIAAAVPTKPLFSGQANVVPTVLSGPSDMTWTATRWIGADPGASSFLAGTFDPYGMHVNTNYLGLTYPANTFQVQDPTQLWANEYQLATFGLSKVVNYQAVNQDSGANVPFTNPNGSITYTKDPPQPVGHRALITVLDQGDAALDHFPTAKISNAAGDYVRPTNGAAGRGAEPHEQRRQRHAADEPHQQRSQGLPADHGDLRDGAHQRALPRQGRGRRPLPRLRRRRRADPRHPAGATARRLPAPAGLAAGPDQETGCGGRQPDRRQGRRRRGHEQPWRRLRLLPLVLFLLHHQHPRPGRQPVGLPARGANRTGDHPGRGAPTARGPRPASALHGDQADPRRPAGTGRLIRVAGNRRGRRARPRARVQRGHRRPGPVRAGPHQTESDRQVSTMPSRRAGSARAQSPNRRRKTQ